MIAGGETAPRHTPFGSREFQARVFSAVVLAAIVLSALVLGGWPFALIWLAAAIVAAAEWIGIRRIAPRRALLAVTALTLTGLVASLQLGAPVAAIVVIGGLGLGAALVLAKGEGGRLAAALGLIGAGILALVPTALRNDPAIGILGPAWMFAVVWSTDIVAYFTGRALGGPKLMPRVSPKKTWSGALGGLAAGTGAGIGLVLFAREHGWSTLAAAPLPAVALASALASVLSQAGDLAESAVKRRCGVKDSGRSIPGHGGAMDRLDGFFAVALLVGLALIIHRLAAA